MARFHPLLAVLLIALLAAPAAPAVAGTTSSAGPDAPPTTFNVVRLGLYPPVAPQDFYYGQVLANDDRQLAFLVHNAYDSQYPTLSVGLVDAFNIADPQNPIEIGTPTEDDHRIIHDIDLYDRYLALALEMESMYSFAGGFEVIDGSGAVICDLVYDYATYGNAYSVAVNDLYAYVGVAKGLVMTGFEGLPDQTCTIDHPLFPTSPIYDIVQQGLQLVLGQSDGVRVVNAAYWPPPVVAFYPVPYPVVNVAISPANYIYAATENGLYIIDGASGLVTHYGPYNDHVKVAVDGSRVYLGTYLDLQVLDFSAPNAPVLIGDYVDPDMEFNTSLSFAGGLVHSTKGIFMYRPDLLLEAQSAGVTLNGVQLASGTSVVAKAGDRITEAPRSAATVKVRCSAVSVPKPEVDVRQVATSIAPEFPTAVIDVVLDPTLLGLWAAEECNKQTSLARLLTDPPALPLSLVSGGVQMQVPAIAGAVKVDTTYASSLAAGGTTFQAGQNPTAGVSRFVCLAGSLQVQPTAAGAPPLTLDPGQFVDVTAAGAGPVGQLRYVYLPLLRR
jgi:hypothetical protein